LPPFPERNIADADKSIAKFKVILKIYVADADERRYK